MISSKGILENRFLLIGALLLCSYNIEAAWITTTKHLSFQHDLLHVFGVAFSIFICGSIAYRSRFLGDRIVFGVGGTALIVVAVKMAPIPRVVFLVAGVTEILMWVMATAVCFIILVRSFRLTRQE
jgi:hypothetical protein